MKRLAVLLTVVISLLVGSFSLPTAHAMSVMSTANNVSSAMTNSMGEHDCCPEAVADEQQQNCHQQSSFCQHCEQHCAGQIGLVGLTTALDRVISPRLLQQPTLSLWQRTERLIRPPRLTTAS